MDFYLGIDFGTSGVRGVVINHEACTQAEIKYPWPDEAVSDLATVWETALFTLLAQIPEKLRREVKAIAINGTSSTVLLTDAAGKPVDAPLLYNDARGAVVLEQLRNIAPAHHNVLSATSSLAKLLWMMQQPSFSQARYFLHQADWLGFLLHGYLGISDYHNALKLGYDVEQLKYPAWLEKLQLPIQLPKVLTPGTPIAKLRPEIATQFNFPDDCLVCAGTTDSIAAFLASGAKSPGEAVTSLGSTLVVKLLSRTRVEDSRYGIYSHRLGNLWLTGGASNTGGAVLKQFFSAAELERLSSQIDVTTASGLDYYPLLRPGDRFPINDPDLPPRLEPRPDDPVAFLHGLLEGMARIEGRGYGLLQEMGADTLTRVYTAGGGAGNSAWCAIREGVLRVSVVSSVHTEAAFGSALLALQGWKKRTAKSPSTPREELGGEDNSFDAVFEEGDVKVDEEGEWVFGHF